MNEWQRDLTCGMPAVAFIAKVQVKPFQSLAQFGLSLAQFGMY